MPFETDFSGSLKDLKKANRARVLVMLKSNWIFFLLIFIGIPAMISGHEIITGDKGAVFTLVTSPILMVIMLFIAVDISTKMLFEKNNTKGNLSIHYTFYDDEFQMETPLIKNTVRYDALNSIGEDKDYFFFKLSPSKVLVIQKNNCSPELISFLQGKAVNINSRGKTK